MLRCCATCWRAWIARAVAAPGPVPVRMVAGGQEVAFGVAERRVAAGLGAGPGRDVRGGLQQAAAVEVGGVVGVVGPLSSGVVQPGADDPVGVSVGEPG